MVRMPPCMVLIASLTSSLRERSTFFPKNTFF
jgi:hypothetical protein